MGIIDIEQFRQYIDGVNGRMAAVKKQICAIRDKQLEIQDTAVPVTKEQIFQFTEKTKSVLKNIDFAQKRALILGILYKVVVNNQELRVMGKLPITADNNYNYGALCSIHRYRGPA